MDTLTAKVISLFILLLITVVFGILPVPVLHFMNKKVTDSTKLHKFVSFMNTFAGGVFLATCVLHLIEESMEKVEEAISTPYESLAGVLIGAGFFLVMFLEHVVEMCSLRNSKTVYDLEHSSSKTHEKISFKTGNHTKYSQDSNNTSIKTSTISHPNNIDQTKVDASNTHADHTDIDLLDKNSKLRAIILVLAISIHMLFEGLAIGLQDTEADTWTLLIALSVHKCVIAFSIGLKMKQTFSHSNCKLYLYMILFACVSPIGVGIGIGISNCDDCGDARDISSGVLQSLAAGIFLYVTFFEILQKELAKDQSFLKIFLCAMGFGIIAALKVLE